MPLSRLHPQFIKNIAKTFLKLVNNFITIITLLLNSCLYIHFQFFCYKFYLVDFNFNLARMLYAVGKVQSIEYLLFNKYCIS